MYQFHNQLHRFLRVLLCHKEKVRILSIGCIRHLTGIDLMCIHDNSAGLGLTENPGQTNHRKYFTVDHITEHISCTYRWKLINISHQDQTHVRRDGFHQRIHQNNINHRTLIHD